MLESGVLDVIGCAVLTYCKYKEIAMPYELPKLPYAYDALEPFIDAKTMELHHTKHHNTYVQKLNAALEKHTTLQTKPLAALLTDLNGVPSAISGEETKPHRPPGRQARQ